MVGGDMAEVDLDWWNTRLDSHRIPVRLWGRNADGVPVNRGKAFLSRDDINGSLPSKGPADLVVLYRAAAWLKGHRKGLLQEQVTQLVTRPDRPVWS